MFFHFQLEILHGVLNDIEASKNRSFFYMRGSVNKDNVDEQEFKVGQFSF